MAEVKKIGRVTYKRLTNEAGVPASEEFSKVS